MESLAPDEARNSLDSIGAVRLDVAKRLTTPWWYHLVLGLLVAQVVLAYGLLDLEGNPRAALLRGLSLMLEVLGSFWLQRKLADRTGLAIRLPSARHSWAAFAVFVLGMGAPFLYVGFADDPTHRVVVSAALASLVSTIVFGRIYDAAYRADLRRREAA